MIAYAGRSRRLAVLSRRARLSSISPVWDLTTDARAPVGMSRGSTAGDVGLEERGYDHFRDLFQLLLDMERL